MTSQKQINLGNRPRAAQLEASLFERQETLRKKEIFTWTAKGGAWRVGASLPTTVEESGGDKVTKCSKSKQGRQEAPGR